TRGAIWASATPIAVWRACAGFVRGPRTVNAVGTLIWRLTAATNCMEGGQGLAEEEDSPASWAMIPVCFGVMSNRTSRASSTSAEPDADDVARLPCLTTRWPVAEMIMAAVDEMFAVFARSPPVPTMSTESARPGRGTA